MRRSRDLPEEIQAYQQALATWQAFHETVRHPFPDERALATGAVSEDQQLAFLRALPAVERRPAAFGVFVRSAGNWSPLRQSMFLGEFIQGPLQIERRLLEAAARGAQEVPRRMPVTIEEFPSRIWKRALESGLPSRLLSAAYLAYDAMVDLQEQHEDDTDLEDLMTFRIPSGDLPAMIDLAALPPNSLTEWKSHIVDRILEEINSGRFEISAYDLEAVRGWVLADTSFGPPILKRLVAEATMIMKRYQRTLSLRDYHHTRRVGRLMVRLGFRRLALQCAKALGSSAWALGWQHQVISSATQSRIREIIRRPGSDVNAWMREPALACSSMTIPLWLADGVQRMPELIKLFRRAEECPWIFPRLQPIYQWHLALAGKLPELRRVEQLAPELSIALSEISNPTSHEKQP